MKALSVIAVALSVGIASAAPFARLEGRAIEVETVSHVENNTPATDGDPYGPFKSRRAVEGKTPATDGDPYGPFKRAVEDKTPATDGDPYGPFKRAVEDKTPATDGDPYGPFRRAVEEEMENEARSLDDALEERDPKDNRNGAARAPIFRGDPGFLQ